MKNNQAKFFFNKENQFVLHENDFYEWFIAKNNFENYFVASLMDEDEDNGFLIYLYTFVSNPNLSLFLNQKISYKQLIQRNEALYLVRKYYNYKIANIGVIKHFSDKKINLPHHTLFAPERDYKNMELFSFLNSPQPLVLTIPFSYYKSFNYNLLSGNQSFFSVQSNSSIIEYPAYVR